MNSSQQDMTMVWLSGVIILILLLAFSYSTYSTCFCSQQSVEQNVTLTETLFTAPVPVATPMPFVVQSSELVVPSIGGVVIQGGTNNYIRVAGTATTDATRNTVGTSNNQIQIYNAGNLTAAFDVDGLYVKALNTGSGTISCGAITSTGASSFASITGTGAISCGAITSTGTSSFGSITGTGSISCGAITCGSITSNGTQNSSLLFQNTSKFWYTGIRGDTSDEYAIYNDAFRFQISQSGLVTIPGTITVNGASSFGSINTTGTITSSGQWPQITFTGNATTADVGMILNCTAPGGRSFTVASAGSGSGAGAGFYIYDNPGGLRLSINSSGNITIPGILSVGGTLNASGTLNVSGPLNVSGSLSNYTTNITTGNIYYLPVVDGPALYLLTLNSSLNIQLIAVAYLQVLNSTIYCIVPTINNSNYIYSTYVNTQLNLAAGPTAAIQIQPANPAYNGKLSLLRLQ